MNRSTLRILIIVTAVVTALVHLALGVGGILTIGVNTLGVLCYLALLAALFVPNVPVFADNRALAHYLMIAYAALTFVLYFMLNGFSHLGAAAIVAKLAELILMSSTWMHLRAAE